MSTLTLPPVTVRVTGRHIAAGKRREACDCALSLAITDALRESGARPTVVVVAPDADGEWRARASVPLVPGERRRFTAPLPVEAARWVPRYDSRLAVRPFEFDLKWRAEA